MLLAKQRWVWGERPQIFESSPILHAPKPHKSDFFMFLRPEVHSHFHFMMSPLFLECQSEACQASPHLMWSRSVFPCCQFWTIPQKSASSYSAPSNARKGELFLLLWIAESWMWAFNWEMDTSKDSCATQISHLSILATFTATAFEWPRLNT